MPSVDVGFTPVYFLPCMRCFRDVALRHSELFSEINCTKRSRHIPCNITVLLILGQTYGSHAKPADELGAQPGAYHSTGIVGSGSDHLCIYHAFPKPFPSLSQAFSKLFLGICPSFLQETPKKHPSDGQVTGYSWTFGQAPVVRWAVADLAWSHNRPWYCRARNSHFSIPGLEALTLSMSKGREEY